MKNGIWPLIFLLLPLFIFGEGWYQEADHGFSVAIEEIDRETTVLQKIPVVIRLRFPPTHRIDANKLQNQLLRYGGFGIPPWSLESVTVSSPESVENGLVEQKILFELRAQLTGQYPLSFFAIAFDPKNPKSGNTVEIFSKVFFIKVNPLPVTDWQILPKPSLEPVALFPIELGAEQRLRLANSGGKYEREKNETVLEEHTIPWFGILFFAGGVLFVIFVQQSVKKDNEVRENSQEELSQSIRTEALEALADLKHGNLSEQENTNLYVHSVSKILRVFVEKEYQLMAPTLTTEEFLQEIKRSTAFNDSMRNTLAEFLRQADAVKFAKHILSEKDCEHLEELAKTFIGS
jgi:hypothetical protein